MEVDVHSGMNIWKWLTMVEIGNWMNKAGVNIFKVMTMSRDRHLEVDEHNRD